MTIARVVEQADTRDLKSLGSKGLYQFDSGPGHFSYILRSANHLNGHHYDRAGYIGFRVACRP